MLHTIPEAIEAIRQGRLVIVVDDENRENEGDFIGAAEKVTPEMINFMVTEGRGLICAPLLEQRCHALQLERMVKHNSDPMGTAFTISIDKRGDGVTTGISASDRAKTIRALTDPEMRPQDLNRPGHVFPLIAKEGGVLRRTGHTEAAVDLARLAGLTPAGVLVEIMNKDGSMARLPELERLSEKLNIEIITIKDLVAYRMRHDSLIQREERFPVHTRFGEFAFHAYRQTNDDQYHYALTKGLWDARDEVLVRVHTLQHKNDLIAFLTSNTQEELEPAFQLIQKASRGAIVFVNPQQTPDSMRDRVAQFKGAQARAHYGNPAVKMDQKDYGIGAQIIHELGIQKLKLITRRPQKRIGIEGYGIRVVGSVSF